MDTLTLTIFTIIVFMITSANVKAEVYDLGDGTSFMKSSEGNTFRVKSSDVVSIGGTPSGTSLSVTEKVNIPTSKGSMAIDLPRTVPVDISRVGKAFAKFAIASGPVGMAINIAQLACDLSSICNVDGKWNVGYVNETMPSGNSVWNCSGFGDMTLSACKQDIHQCNSPTYICFDDAVAPDGKSLTFKKKYASNGQLIGTATLTRITAWTSNQNPGTEATQADWDAKASQLNDPRFVPELLTKEQPVRVGLPQVPTNTRYPISSETTTTRDAAGNATGTQTKQQDAEVTTPSPSQNPTNSPTVININERTVINNYNTDNQLTSSTTTNSETKPPVPQNFDIKFDDSTDTLIEKYTVPATLNTDSWGSGSCPADRQVSYHYGQLNLSFQPACDMAVMANPVIIAIAGIIGLFIISGAVRND